MSKLYEKNLEIVFLPLEIKYENRESNILAENKLMNI